MITSLRKKKGPGKEKGERGKEKKEKNGKEKKEKGKGKEGKRGKRKEIGNMKNYGFWLTQENKQNLFGEKIFIPQGERVSYIFEM